MAHYQWCDIYSGKYGINNHNSSETDINTEDASACNPVIINSEIEQR